MKGVLNMIIDKLCNSALYYGLSPEIENALKYLQNNYLKVMEPGTYNIDDYKMYISVAEYETKSIHEALWEAHRKYIDIQYVIQGSEKMGYTNIENIKATVEYDANKDILFGEGTGDFVTVSEGEFIIFMPQDGHMPCINVGESKHIKKVVVKILID